VTALDGITRPTLVVDRARAERNIARMAAKAAAGGARFRPHVKTHQSPAIAAWYRAAGVDAITVSSVAMAERFAGHGWRDITVAFPFNPREAPALHGLTEQGVRLGLLVDSVEALRQLDASGLEADTWIEVDAGYHRTGVDADDADGLVDLARAIRRASPRLRFAGLLTHSGHTYAGRSRAEVLAIHEASVAAIKRSQASLAAAGIDAPVSIGDTPGCNAADGFEGIDEIRPGNFVLLDLQQLQTGTCAPDDLALAVACPVVGRYPGRGSLVIHGGSAHFSRDAADGPDGRPMYGRVATLADDGWSLPDPAARLTSLAQEHGTITGPDEASAAYDVGALVLVVPAHACLACASTRRFVTLDGEPID
jgi:D-serine deaminase-like pyridoxal phosphate-dependent protein